MDRTKISKNEIDALSKAACLDLSEARKQTMVEVMPGIFQMLDSLKQIKPGETAPAITFQARWENQR